MFLKLCVMEIKCSWRSFCFMYFIMILSAIILQFQIDGGLLMELTGLVFSGTVFALLIMIVVNVIRNYYISMFGKQAYLTHTLPVGTTQLLLSKAFGAVFWAVASLSVILFCTALFLFQADRDPVHLFQLAVHVFQQSDFLWMMVWMQIRLFISGLTSLFLIYLIMNFTYSCYIKHHRGLIGILLYVILGMTTSYLMLYISMLFPNHIQNDAMISMGIDLLLLCAYFYGARYLLDHKLELE